VEGNSLFFGYYLKAETLSVNGESPSSGFSCWGDSQKCVIFSLS
jgi:hypothetical protein